MSNYRLARLGETPKQKWFEVKEVVEEKQLV